MAENITELNGDNFDDFIKEGNCIIDFGAEWCGPCRMIAPNFEEAANELKGKVKFGRVDVDEGKEIAEKFRIMAVPTLIFFKNNKNVERISGLMGKEEIVIKCKDIFD